MDGGIITNIVTNPSAYVNTANWSSWGGNGGGVINMSSVTATWATRGRAARSTWTTGNTTLNGDLGWQLSNAGNSNSLVPNTQYTASWKVRTSKNQNMQPLAGNWTLLNGAQGSGSGVVNSSSGVTAVTPTSAVSQWITFTAGANTCGAKIYSTLGSGASTWNAGDYIEVSDFMIVEGATVYNFADGSTPNWTWNGAANSSSSTGPPQ